MTKPVETYLKLHTSEDKSGAYSTFRNSSEQAFAWTKTIDHNFLPIIESACSNVLDAFGYRKFNSSQEESSLLVPKDEVPILNREEARS